MVPDTSDKIPIDQIASWDTDKGVLMFGTVPLALLTVVAVVFAVVYFIRRGKNWNTIGAALRTNDPDHLESEEDEESDKEEDDAYLDAVLLNAEPADEAEPDLNKPRSHSIPAIPLPKSS